MQSATDTLEQIIDLVLDIRNNEPDFSVGIDKVLAAITNSRIRGLALSGRPLNS